MQRSTIALYDVRMWYDLTNLRYTYLVDITDLVLSLFGASLDFIWLVKFVVHHSAHTLFIGVPGVIIIGASSGSRSRNRSSGDILHADLVNAYILHVEDTSVAIIIIIITFRLSWCWGCLLWFLPFAPMISIVVIHCRLHAESCCLMRAI